MIVPSKKKKKVFNVCMFYVCVETNIVDFEEFCSFMTFVLHK